MNNKRPIRCWSTPLFASEGLDSVFGTANTEDFFFFWVGIVFDMRPSFFQRLLHPGTYPCPHFLTKNTDSDGTDQVPPRAD